MWFTVVLALSIHLIAAELCPEGRKTCAQGMTCCELPSGEHGCCPYDNATCCPDGVHCCPHGHNCLTGRCGDGHRNVDTELSKLMVDYQEPSNELDIKSQQTPNASLMVSGIVCPDGQQCGNADTCCEISPNLYGCCPFHNGVCCQHSRTCCPSQYSCLPAGWCEKEMPDNTQEPIKQLPVNTICPGGHQICPTGQTCCPHYASWGCCPFLAATCCSDQLHCCPHDFRCDVRGYCTKVSDEN
ncbi:granulins-like isoform X2 [Zootermopsis nevadensis]|nr:granulins-like isoform X2 [Zootermopsis nevadensis]XP_021927361.1 granulins-like isoform X2 [Zootermopsis nevadensis]XP_021927363.1 granulins-like isoform X2 [Zootermopsis nevadensis]XP_021927364.1 granulins-like isoform X2 [Zootermopsis nevadensis]XP_021927365.1 granulins-like isoform X2 [Zootermopsis nevadensis]XP_021927366.1 granulins-like isoform X2 [Zootermopsis nevadensis]